MDQVRQLGQPGILILAVVDGLQLGGSVLDGLQMSPHLLEAADQAGLVLHLLHDALCPDDHVPDALTGDAGVFRDLSQGQVLVVVEVEEFLLPLGEEFAVKIEEHGHAIRLIFHELPHFCKAVFLYNEK